MDMRLMTERGLSMERFVWHRVERGRAIALAAMLTAGATAGAREAPPHAAGPFAELRWTDGVTTSRNGYAVWVAIGSAAHRIRIPGHATEVSAPEHDAALYVECRAPGGGLSETFPPAPATGGIYLDNHPEQADAYTVLEPMYWILELGGGGKERWPVEVRIGGQAPIASTLVRARTNYSAPRPGLDIALPGRAVIDALGGTLPIDVEATGPGMTLEARFMPMAEARRAAELMRRRCPKAHGPERP